MRNLSVLRFRGSSLALLAVLAAPAIFAACSIGSEVDGVFHPGTTSSGSTTTSSSSSSSTTTSFSGTGGTGGIGQGGSGGGTVTGPEDCLDGADNDGDGNADCADTECQPDFECIDSVPAGWDGYFDVSQSAFPSPNPVQCGDNNPATVLYTGPAGPAECTACSCGDVQGATCGPPLFSCYPNSGSCMSNPVDLTQQLLNGACQKPNFGFINALSCNITGPPIVIQPGSCAPSAVDFANKAPWDGEVAACPSVESGGGCGTGKACMPKQQPGSNESICIRQEGQHKCPAGWTQTIHAYTEGADTRSCTACSCGDPNTTCQGGEYTVYDLNNCDPNGSDPPITFDAPGCKNVSILLDSGSWSMQATLPTPAGSCQASGGQPAGAMQATGPVTFCCR